MNLRIKILYFVDGISMLGGRQSIAVEKNTPGVPQAQSIRRIPTGYLIGWQDKLYEVPASRVLCAEVEVEEDAPFFEPAPHRQQDLSSPPAPVRVAPPQPGKIPEGSIDLGNGIWELPNGQKMRVSTTSAPALAPTAAPAVQEPLVAAQPETTTAPDAEVGQVPGAAPYKHDARRRGPTPGGTRGRRAKAEA